MRSIFARSSAIASSAVMCGSRSAVYGSAVRSRRRSGRAPATRPRRFSSGIDGFGGADRARTSGSIWPSASIRATSPRISSSVALTVSTRLLRQVREVGLGGGALHVDFGGQGAQRRRRPGGRREWSLPGVSAASLDGQRRARRPAPCAARRPSSATHVVVHQPLAFGHRLRAGAGAGRASSATSRVHELRRAARARRRRPPGARPRPRPRRARSTRAACVGAGLGRLRLEPLGGVTRLDQAALRLGQRARRPRASARRAARSTRAPRPGARRGRRSPRATRLISVATSSARCVQPELVLAARSLWPSTPTMAFSWR